jgi:hypothetical protein
MKKILAILIILASAIHLKAQEKQVTVPYTLADRDRLIRMEIRLNEFEAKTNDKFEILENKINESNKRIEDKFLETNKKIDRLEDKFDSYFMWGFGLVLMSVFSLMGFIIYDRRTTLAPVQNKTEKIINALKETAEKNDDLREALKRMSLW